MPPKTRRKKTQEEQNLAMQRGRRRERSPERRDCERDRSPIAGTSHQSRSRREATPHPGTSRWREGSPSPDTRGRREGNPHSAAHDAWWAPADQTHQAPSDEPQQGLLNFLVEEVNALKKQLSAQLQGDIIDELHITVTPELQEKIWSNKFVDLSQLLEKNHQALEDETHNSRVCGYQDDEGNLTFKAKKPQKSNLTIEQWSSAFNTFISVYILKHPRDIQGLLSYAELVRGAAHDHPKSNAWRTYDGRFRTKKALDPTRPWGMVDNQMWLALFCKPQDSQTKEGTSDKPQKDEKNANQKGCNFFNKSKGCYRKSCPFPHKCSICGKGSHGAASCWHDKKKGTAEHQQQKVAPDSGAKDTHSHKIPTQTGNRSFRSGN